MRVLSSSSAFATALLLLSLLAAALVRTCLSTAAAAANQHLAVHGLDYHLIFASASRVSSALRLDVHFCASFYAPDRDRAVRLQSQSSPQQPAGSGSHGSARRQRSTQEDNPGKLGGGRGAHCVFALAWSGRLAWWRRRLYPRQPRQRRGLCLAAGAQAACLAADVTVCACHRSPHRR